MAKEILFHLFTLKEKFLSSRWNIFNFHVIINSQVVLVPVWVVLENS